MAGLTDIPLLSQLRGRMAWLHQRQRVVAENVANADVAGYVARDLKAPDGFAAMVAGTGHSAGGRLRMITSGAGHIAPAATGAASVQTVAAPDSETTLNGNSVVLEEEMLKMAESRMAYDAAIGFYQKSMNMLRLAARAPGR